MSSTTGIYDTVVTLVVQESTADHGLNIAGTEVVITNTGLLTANTVSAGNCAFVTTITEATASAGTNVTADLNIATGGTFSNVYHCKIMSSGGQSVVTFSNTLIVLDATDHDSSSVMANTAGSRVDIPVSGRYLVAAGAAYQGGGKFGMVFCYIYVNGAVVEGAATSKYSNNCTPVSTAVVDLNAGDYVQLYVYQSSGSTRTIGASSNHLRNFLSCSLISS